jgi:hypothetical protein
VTPAHGTAAAAVAQAVFLKRVGGLQSFPAFPRSQLELSHLLAAKMDAVAARHNEESTLLSRVSPWKSDVDVTATRKDISCRRQQNWESIVICSVNWIANCGMWIYCNSAVVEKGLSVLLTL